MSSGGRGVNPALSACIRQLPMRCPPGSQDRNTEKNRQTDELHAEEDGMPGCNQRRVAAYQCRRAHISGIIENGHGLTDGQALGELHALVVGGSAAEERV